MSINNAALKLGLQLVQAKLGQAMGDPSFSVLPQEQPTRTETPAELPTTDAQIRDRSAKIQAPKIVTTR